MYTQPVWLPALLLTVYQTWRKDFSFPLDSLHPNLLWDTLALALFFSTERNLSLLLSKVAVHYLTTVIEAFNFLLKIIQNSHLRAAMGILFIPSIMPEGEENGEISRQTDTCVATSHGRKWKVEICNNINYLLEHLKCTNV